MDGTDKRVKLAVPVAGWATQGQYALVEACVDADTELPAHVAQREDVVLYVLDGELEGTVDRTPHRARTGEALVLDRGLPRRLRATAPTRVLVLIAPAGLEELLPLAADPAVDPDDRAALLAVGGVHRLPDA
ncbi:MAG TPA: cupin domain-containing protein [Solirubrobacter sp.]|nr:cupin domain-containing protein [Solirubrobacter sp.]